MQILKSLTRAVTSPVFFGSVITLLFVIAAFLFYARFDLPQEHKSPLFHVLHRLHENSIDARLRARGFRPGSPDVAIVAVDEESIESMGRWPWSRDLIARMIDSVMGHGAKALAFDMIFSEPDANSSAPTLLRLKSKLHENKLSTAPVVRLIDQELLKANSDQILAMSVERNKAKLVMGVYFDSTTIPLSPVQELCWDAAYQKTATFQHWSHDATAPIVNDTASVELPSLWQQTLDSHFRKLTLESVRQWMRGQELGSVRAWLKGSLGAELTTSQLELLLLSWLEKDSERLKELFPTQTKTADSLVVALSDRLRHLRRDLLARSTEESHRKYCSRFLTRDDELLPEFEKSWETVRSSNPEWATLSFDEGASLFRAQALNNPVYDVGRFWMNIPQLIDASENNGFFNAHLDSDAAVRKAWVIARSGTQYVTSIAMKTFLAAAGSNLLVTLEPNLNQPESKKISEMRLIDAEGAGMGVIPVDTTGKLVINYAGPRYMFPHISAADLIENKPDVTVTQRTFEQGHWRIDKKSVPKAEFLKNKYLIAGATATGIYDLRVTPFEENYPGVETHANVLDNLMRSDFLRVNSDEEIYMPLFLLGLGIVLTALLAYLGAVAGFALICATLVSLYYVDQMLFFRNGTLTNLAMPVLLVMALYVFLTFYKYFTEERKKKELKGTFEKYVSPAIVEEILADPSHLELGGRKEMITVFFSDVRGFTTISEKLDPRALSDLLNSYLTPMTRLVFENKGTLDKYMGDAIMAFFGAPIHYSDHAKYACRCALAHLKKLYELQNEYERKGLPTIDIGIGLNTGEMSVGNMGSDIVRNYTVMGDAVNLGSRLEGINKQYGTRVIISEFTEREVRGDFITRAIDRVRVKGKALPVEIYELIAESKAPEDVTEMLKWFNEGYQLYHERRWDQGMSSFTQALNILPDDACSKLYLDRCSDYLQNPPPGEWDGVFTMTTK